MIRERIEDGDDVEHLLGPKRTEGNVQQVDERVDLDE